MASEDQNSAVAIIPKCRLYIQCWLNQRSTFASHAMTYIPPTVLESKFTCPHCEAIAMQSWESRNDGFYKPGGPAAAGVQSQYLIRIAHCAHCRKYSLWHAQTMVYPELGTAPPPNADMPSEVMHYYREAAAIAQRSPRSAAALLRLAVQVLCIELGEQGKNINDDIASLVKKGLPPLVQKSLDVVRIVGNNAVHPGQIDTDDDVTVGSLFGLLNIIVDYMISMPKRVDATYGNLPSTLLEAITKRDNPK